MKHIVGVAVSSSLGGPARKNDPHVLFLSSLNCLLQALDTLGIQIALTQIVGPTIRVPIVPIESDQSYNICMRQILFQVDSIVWLEKFAPPVHSVKCDWLVCVGVDYFGAFDLEALCCVYVCCEE